MSASDTPITEGSKLGTKSTSTTVLPRRKFFDDMPDKGLFAGVATFGFAMIIGLKVQGFSAEIVSGFAVAVMMIYGSIAYRIPAVQLRLDRLGDNFYYLGFIYTLASLTAALVQLRSGLSADTILESFGIALITTIIGVAGRVVFVQMRSEIDDLEEVIRREILEASASLKGQLSAALQDLDTFRTGVHQATSESLSRNSDHSRAYIDQITSVAQQAAIRINEAFEARQGQSQKLLEITIRLSAALDQSIQRLEGIEKSSDGLEHRLQEFAEAIGHFVRRLDETVSIVSQRSPRRRWWHWWGNR